MTGPSEACLLHEEHYENSQVKDQIGLTFTESVRGNWQENKLFYAHCPGKLDILLNLKGIKTSNCKNLE